MNMKDYEIKITVSNASNEFRSTVYALLNKLAIEYPDNFSYETLEK